MSTIGSLLVYCFKESESEKLNTVFFGFAAGIMIAASIWSLLLPAIEEAERLLDKYAVLPIVFGVLFGGALMILFEKALKVFEKRKNHQENGAILLKKSAKLFFAVTLHNIPEGLAVGFAFGVASVLGNTAAYFTALGLAFGIGIQNFPEGLAVSLPISAELKNKSKAFFYGVLSGVIEPVFAVIGYFTATYLNVLQPWLLSFSAGAMLFVVAEELIPNAKSEKSCLISACFVLLGFSLMMALDVAFG